VLQKSLTTTACRKSPAKAGLFLVYEVK